MLISWGKKVSPAFIEKLLKITKEMNWSAQQASWLMGCIAFETGETFSPTIKNAAGSGAIGLIQFMPKTAIGLGTDTFKLGQMTAELQLDYVKKYFLAYAGKTKTLEDMYMAILMPKYIGAQNGEPLFRSPSIAFKQNAGLDANKDGVVTKGEASAKVLAKWEKGLGEGYALRLQ